MRYIKIYENFEEDFDKIYTPLINWELIADAKDMALEYIDQNMLFKIIVCDQHTYVYANTFTHITNDKKWNPLNTPFESIRDLGGVDISYLIYLRDLTKSINEEASEELCSRLSEMYPDDKIELY